VKGFTLVELIIVILVLAILAVTAAPKYADLSQDAENAVFTNTAVAFQQGVKQVHYRWILRGNGQAIQNFIPITDPIAGGDLSVNDKGYPADTRGFSRTLNSTFDCLDVWRAVLDSQGAAVEGDASMQYQATYDGDNACTYSLVSNSSKTVKYDSNTGQVLIQE